MEGRGTGTGTGRAEYWDLFVIWERRGEGKVGRQAVGGLWLVFMDMEI